MYICFIYFAERAADQVTAGRGGLRARIWQHLRCGLVAGQVTAGSCNMRGGLRAQMSGQRRALVDDNLTDK